MIFCITKRNETWEIKPVEHTSEPINKVFKLPIRGLTVVFTSIVIPYDDDVIFKNAILHSTALYEAIKLVEAFEAKAWRKDFGQI